VSRIHLDVTENSSASSREGAPASAFEIMLSRARIDNSLLRIRFPLISCPKDLMVVELCCVEVVVLIRVAFCCGLGEPDFWLVTVATR